MCIPLAAAVIGSAILGAGVSLVQGAAARKQARTAQEQNVQMAQATAQRAEEQFNRLNQKQPAIAQLWARNRQRAAGGIGSTFLTGTQTNPGAALGGQPSVLGA